MPPINSGSQNTNQVRPKKVKRPKTPKVHVTVPDANEETRTRAPQATGKVRMYAHPQRPAAQKVFRQQAQDEAAAKAKAKALKRTVAKIKVTPVPSPDATDSLRSPAQQEHDRAAAAQSVRVSRTKFVVKRDQVRAKAILTGRGGKVIDASKQFEAGRLKAQQERAAHLAPVLSVLEQTTRPLHAVAGAVDAAINRPNLPGSHSVSKAAVRGLQNKDKTTFSDVLKHAGVKNKAVRGVAGFALDVGLDPTTAVTGGTGSVAEKAAEKAGIKAAKAATAAGLSKKEVKRAVSTASRAAYKANVAKGSGATVKFAGHEVPGVRRVTAAAGRGGGKTLRKVVPERARNAARDAVGEVSPSMTPVGVSKSTHQAARDATRKARATANNGQRSAVNVAHGIHKQIGEKNYAAVVDAVESGSIPSLPAHLQPHGRTLAALLADIRKVQTDAGVKVPERKGYIPRKLTAKTIKAEQKKAGQVGGRGSTSPASSKARKELRTMAELRTQEPGRYREDLHALIAERLAEGHASAARAHLAQDIANLGREVPRGTKVHLGDREALYKVRRGEELQQISPNDKKFLRPGTGKSRYVVLNRGLVDRAMGSIDAPAGGTIRHGYDKVQGGFKRLALATPGFHIRNIIGDTSQAYVHQPGYKLTGNMVRAGRVLKAAGRNENAQRKLAPTVAGKGALKTKRYGHVSYEEAANRLIAAGAARSGYTARELRELGSSGSKKIRTPKTPAAARRVFLNREDLPRLATAIHALREGATYEQAARKVADVHFDYAELTPFERNVARRILPFYTWTSRNVPLQAKSIVSRPGKYAAYQKVREEAAKATQPEQQDPQTQAYYKQLEAAGVKLPGGWEKYLSEYEQRNAGVPVKWKGQNYTVSAGLPLNDLSELPGFAGGITGQAREYYNKAASLVTPVVKDPVEIGANYSFFFRNQVEQDDSPLVSAPSFVAKFPASEKQRLGIVQGKDKRSGKTVWKWPGKVDYIAHTPPGLANMALKLATPGADRQGRGLGGKALQVAGIRSQPIDARSNAVNLAYARQVEIQKRQAALRETNNPKNGLLISAKNPTPEYIKLSAQLKLVQRVAYQAKLARGDATLPTVGGPPKGRSSTKVHLGGSTSKVHLGSPGGVKVHLGGS